MSTQPLRLYKEDLEKLKIAAATSGKDEKDILHEMLGKAIPEDITEELLAMAKAKAPSKRSTEAVAAQPTPTTVQIGERVKSIIADAVETRVYLRTLGIDLGDQQRQQQSPYQQYPPQYPQMPEPKKDMREWIMEMKAIESLEKKESDPDIKDILKEQKETLRHLIEESKKPKEDSFNERLERIALLRTLGQDKAADAALSELKAGMDKKVDDLTDKLDEQKETMHRMEMQGMEDRLTKKIEDLENKPDTLQQAKSLFEMAETDPLMKGVIREVAKSKLGIQESKFSLKDLAKDFDSIPIGKARDFLVSIIKAVKGEAEAPTQPPPPPRTMPQTEIEFPSETELAARVAPELLEQAPSEPSMTTFSEEITPPPRPAQPPSEASLPPEEEEKTGPSPSSGEEKAPPKTKRSTKKE